METAPGVGMTVVLTRIPSGIWSRLYGLLTQ